MRFDATQTSNVPARPPTHQHIARCDAHAPSQSPLRRLLRTCQDTKPFLRSPCGSGCERDAAGGRGAACPGAGMGAGMEWGRPMKSTVTATFFSSTCGKYDCVQAKWEESNGVGFGGGGLFSPLPKNPGWGC